MPPPEKLGVDSETDPRDQQPNKGEPEQPPCCPSMSQSRAKPSAAGKAIIAATALSSLIRFAVCWIV
jgi:hypothetical protein